MFDGAGVEIPQYLRGYPEFPQVSEVKQSLPGLSHCRVSMQRASQALSDVDTKVSEPVHPLHWGPVDVKEGCRFLPYFPQRYTAGSLILLMFRRKLLS